MENYDCYANGVKSSFLKTLQIREYGEGIGFHVWYQKNQSDVVYIKCSSGSHVETAISWMGITVETLIKGAKRLVGKVKEKDLVSLPPNITIRRTRGT